jgi:hypothetical protein
MYMPADLSEEGYEVMKKEEVRKKTYTGIVVEM